MSADFPPEIHSGLCALRKRIRIVQLWRGLLGTLSVAIGGLLVVAALDFLMAPLSATVRAVLFFLWVLITLFAGFKLMIVPLSSKIPLIKLARWFEKQHPEVQERISTSLELSGRAEGISPELLSELSREAVGDIENLDPIQEVRSDRIRCFLWPAMALIVATLSLLMFYPKEMKRLLTRAVTPFSDLGNVGAFRFEVTPGNIEILEGSELSLTIEYSGTVEAPLELLIQKDGELTVEELPVSSVVGETSFYRYFISSADQDFEYSARVGRSESDRYDVKVYPLPRLLEPVVTFSYPSYTEWSERKTPLGSEISALVGTRVTVNGRVETPLKSAYLSLDSQELGELSLNPSAQGTMVTWQGVMDSQQSGLAQLMVEHLLGQKLEGARFGLEPIVDPAPIVALVTPSQRNFKAAPDDQIQLVYEVVEEIGILKATVELEVNGVSAGTVNDHLPIHLETLSGDRWKGETKVYLSEVVKKHPDAKRLRIRILVHDNRPAEYEGPGIGSSEWVKLVLDDESESLVRQELKNQFNDERETLTRAIENLHQAKNHMWEAQGELQKEEVTAKAEQTLSKAREELQSVKENLDDLTDRMEQSIQAHRAQDVENAMARIEEAQRSLEHAPLQDTVEARKSETEHALNETDRAIEQLQQIRQAIEMDHPKMEDLARLQELAQKQEQLAQNATEQQSAEAPSQEWRNQQQELNNQLREEVRQSPEAKATALDEQSQKAQDLARVAGDLRDAQDNLANLLESPQMNLDAQQIQEQLIKEQAGFLERLEEKLDQNLPEQPSDSQALHDAVQNAKEALADAQNSDISKAAPSARDLLNELAKQSETQNIPDSLRQSEQQIAQGFEALEQGDLARAREALEELYAEKNKQQIAEALSKEQEGVVDEVLSQADQASGNSENETQLRDAGKLGQQAAAKLREMELGQAAESAQTAANDLKSASEEIGAEELASLVDKQDQIAEALKSLAEGETSDALKTLRELQEESFADTIREALALEQQAIVEGTRNELVEARTLQQERANELPEALAQAQEALDGLNRGDAQAAAQAAQSAANELKQGSDPTQEQLELGAKQERLSEAYQALANGEEQRALESLESMQAQRGAELAQAIESFPQLEGDQLGTARSQSQQGAQQAAEASQSQSQGDLAAAAQQHQQAAMNFEQTQEALETFAQNLAQQAESARGQAANDRKAPAPGQPLAEAFDQSAQAAQASQGQQAAQSAQAAAQALQQAASQARSAMKQGGKPGQNPAQQPGPNGNPQNQPSNPNDPNNRIRSAQANQGLPPELAKLGISLSDWEKIQATLKSEVSGSGGGVVPDDYRSLVQQYFQRVSKEK